MEKIGKIKKQMVSYEYYTGPHRKIKVSSAEVLLRKDGKVESVTCCILTEKELDLTLGLLNKIKKDFKGKWVEKLSVYEKATELDLILEVLNKIKKDLSELSFKGHKKTSDGD